MDEQKSSKGLAGLSSMLTDVKAIERHAREQVTNMPKNIREKDKAKNVSHKSLQQNQKPIVNEPQSNGSGCMAAIALVFLLFLFFAAAGGKNRTWSKPQQAITPNSSATTSQPQKPPSQQSTARLPKKNVVTGYDENHPYLNDNGLCEITIDNTKNDMPVYVRIWDMKKHQPVRAFYIRQGGTFTANELTPGQYEIRYRELYESGEPSHGTKSQIYTMEQHRTPTGTQYDTLSLTLYKVRNGNARTTRIDAGDI